MLYKRLELPSTSDAIHKVEALIEEIAQDLDVKEDVYGNIMVAVTEAVNNSIIHGNKQDESKKVFVDIAMRHPYRLTIQVTDEGPGFNPESLPDPTAPENIENIGGRGVFLMRHLSDELSFHDDGKTAQMIFNI
ncbi:MAG: ATP-binding protein [Bacteroidetes bacterium]|nr:MAG: ATP-binding protein [Bacteroidota bacterium]